MLGRWSKLVYLRAYFPSAEQAGQVGEPIRCVGSNYVIQHLGNKASRSYETKSSTYLVGLM